MPTRKERSNPKVGCEYVRKFKNKTYKLKVIKTREGIAYDLNDTVFSSPSAAAKSITKTEMNGWKFWKMD